MLDLSEEELGNEYITHYSAYDEGNTIDAEIRTFYSLAPTKDKKYLNYGAGAWNRTIEKLREDSYDVYGYEPYAESKSDYIIRDYSELEKMKFDGIFSHDLLEHLRYPMETFDIFKNLLNPHGKMAHATACYEYLYEYTRFHLIFYTGESINYLCKKYGMKIVEKQIDSENLFINYVYEMEE